MKRRERGLFVFIIFIVIVIANIFTPWVTLESAEIVKLDQAKVRLIIPPGSSKPGTIKAENSSSETKRVRVYLEDWVYLPACDGTKDFKPAGTTELSAAEWISFVPSELVIPPYGKETLSYRVKIPPDAKGGRYAVMFFESALGEGEKMVREGVSVDFAVRIAALFYIEPEGTIIRQARIDNFKIDNREGKFYITAELTNIGNVDITTNGNFFIIDRKGMVYARGEFNNSYTFPGYNTTLIATWKEPIPKGKYDLVLTIDIGRALEELGLGRGPVITKEAKVEIGDYGQVVSVSELK